ncbi:MAG: FliH/SctL family protein [bacterium]
MRIIKLKRENPRVEIQKMDFPVIVEEQPAKGEPGGGYESFARAEEEEARRDEEMRLEAEKTRREAEQEAARAKENAAALLEEARREAEDVRGRAAREAETLKQNAAQEAEAAKKEAYSAGYASGEETGYKEGYQTGYRKGKESALEEAVNRLNMMGRVIEDLKAYRSEILSGAQNDIIRMAISVAERVLHKEIMTDPKAVVSVVKNALSKVSFKKRFVVQVNPLDLDVLEKESAEIAGALDSCESLKFRANPNVEPGGCIVQTESGDVDAQVDRQFQTIKDQVLRAVEEEKPAV